MNDQQADLPADVFIVRHSAIILSNERNISKHFSTRMDTMNQQTEDRIRTTTV